MLTLSCTRSPKHAVYIPNASKSHADKAKQEHGYLAVVAVPNLDNTRGGFVTLTGWEYGLRFGNPELPYNRTNAAFSVIQEDDDCQLKIVEWRETSNLGKI